MAATKYKTPLMVAGSILLFLMLVNAGILYFFLHQNEQFVRHYVQETESMLTYLKENIRESVPLNAHDRIDEMLKMAVTTGVLNQAEVSYGSYLFDDDMLFANSNNPRRPNWVIGDVVTDIRYGEVEKVDFGIYRFNPSAQFNPNEVLPVKFQMSKEDQVADSLTRLRFLIAHENPEPKNLEDAYPIGTVFINAGALKEALEQEMKVVKIKNEIALFRYRVNLEPLLIRTETLFWALFVPMAVVYLVVVLGAVLVNHFYIKEEYIEPFKLLQNYMHDIMQNRFVKVDVTTIRNSHIREAFLQLTKLAKKMAGVTNELNVTRDMLERKNTTDELTGLPNKNLFEREIKRMYIAKENAYVVSAKINKLGLITQEFGSNTANSIIKEFATMSGKYFNSMRESNILLYRFYGAEFALIIRQKSQKEIGTVMERLSGIAREIKQKYNLTDTPIFFGAVPFDLYGDIDALLFSMHMAVQKAEKTPETPFCIEDESKVLEKAKLLEESVKGILETKDFELDMTQKTYVIDEPDTLLMAEVSPILLDEESGVIHKIGTFLAVAEHLKKVIDFDKMVIDKVIETLKDGEITHLLAINLSIKSFTNKKFLNWLEERVKEEPEVSRKLVFSITSYTAAANMAAYRYFLAETSRMGLKTIIKRFSLKDFELEELEKLDVTFIRMGRDVSSDLNKDSAKQHMVKNIILYGEIHDITVLGDGIKSDEDYKSVRKLGLYATSR